jgi:hypothetical protein
VGGTSQAARLGCTLEARETPTQTTAIPSGTWLSGGAHPQLGVYHHGDASPAISLTSSFFSCRRTTWRWTRRRPPRRTPRRTCGCMVRHHAFHHASCSSSCIMHFIMHHALHHAFHPRACPFSCLPRKPPGSRWSYTRISCRVTCEADNTSVKRCTLSTLKDSGEGSFCLLREGRVWGCRHGATRLAAAGTGPAAHHVCSRAVHCAHQSSAVRLPAEWREDLAG